MSDSDINSFEELDENETQLIVQNEIDKLLRHALETQAKQLKCKEIFVLFLCFIFFFR